MYGELGFNDINYRDENRGDSLPVDGGAILPVLILGQIMNREVTLGWYLEGGISAAPSGAW